MERGQLGHGFMFQAHRGHPVSAGPGEMLQENLKQMHISQLHEDRRQGRLKEGVILFYLQTLNLYFVSLCYRKILPSFLPKKQVTL